MRWLPFHGVGVFVSSLALVAIGCGDQSSGIAGGGGTLASGGKGGKSGTGASGGTSASGGSGNAGTGGQATGGGGTGSGGLVGFTCTAEPASSPVLAATVLVDPAAPHPGDTLTVVIKATNGVKAADAPDMQLDVTSASGTANYSKQLLIGGPAIYVYEVPGLELGDVCLLSRIGGQPEASHKLTVTPRPAGASAANGVYKVTTNHQFTCDEQPDWGNEFHVSVRDAAGQGVPNAVVSVRLPDWTDTSTIKNAGTNPLPSELTMDGSGNYDDYFWWPSNGNGYTVFELGVKDAASDRATEITSGWWDTDVNGCRYCPDYSTRNVYGHWSHRIVFQLDSAASQICVVPTDHAGQSACGPPGHIQHAPNANACWPAK